MSAIAGIDYDSSAIDVVLIDEDSGAWLGWHRYDLACGPGGALDRARRVRDLLPSRSTWADEVVAIGIEQPFSKITASLAPLLRVQGAILACLPREIRVEPLPPNRKIAGHGWKALTVGKTNATKTDVARWAIANGAPADVPQDAFDAFCIARAMRQILETEATASQPRGGAR